MSPQLKISVITPSFNQGHFIQETIESVLSQSKKAFEYIVMDGGSSDATVSVLKKYGKKLAYVSKRDKGQTDAINKGLTRVHGDVIAYINSDDYYLPGTFALIEEYFLSHPDVMWVVGDAIIVDSKGTRIQEPIRWYKKILRALYQPWFLFVLNPLPQPSVFIRKEAIDIVGTFDDTLHYTMDYEYWLRLQKAYGSPGFINAPLSAFRIHGDSKGGTVFIKQFVQEYETATKYTSNKLLLGLHALHNKFITGIYTLIK